MNIKEMVRSGSDRMWWMIKILESGGRDWEVVLDLLLF